MAQVEKVSLPPPPPQWVLDLNMGPSPKPKTAALPDPPGYSTTVLSSTALSSKRGNTSVKQQSQVTARKPPTNEEMDQLKMKKAWELAIAPAKSLPMSAFGMWMTGNTLQVFSIFMVFQLFKTPITALSNINATFVRFESERTKSNMMMVKAVFVLCNLLALGLGIYKVNKMGLLPTTRSDWLAWEMQRIPLERAYPDYDTWL